MDDLEGPLRAVLNRTFDCASIKRSGAFIVYGPSDFTPGHLDICSFQLGDPKDCPVCKTKPPNDPQP